MITRIRIRIFGSFRKYRRKKITKISLIFSIDSIVNVFLATEILND